MLGWPTLTAHAQPSVRLGGLGYFDYRYVLASPDEDEEGDNSFGYRRLYLTTDFEISERFEGRFRLEARDNSTTEQGRPAPFVKDAFLRVNDVWGAGHQLVLGLSPPPSFVVSEGVWGYRSLAATILDRNGIVPSRDMGVAARGPLAGDGLLRYGLMVANNSGVRRETDRYKRAYGQLELRPTDALVFTLGADYAGYGDARDAVVLVNGFAGYHGERLRGGLKVFLQRIDLAGDAGMDEATGLSAFGALRLAEAWEAVARLDRLELPRAAEETGETFALVGLAYQPHREVWFIPNVLVSRFDGEEEAHVTGRLTLRLRFRERQ